MKKRIYYILFLVMFVLPLQAETVRISQIDSTRLLSNQDIKLYVNITDESGNPVKKINKENFIVYESADGKKYIKIDNLVNFETMANYQSGINFLLLIDNSGSMYKDIQGRWTKNKSNTRIELAKNAVKNFLQSVSNPKDKVGLAVYNSDYSLIYNLQEDKSKLTAALADIRMPEGNQGYTEIYSSLYLAVNEFKNAKGRKVIIILSDGENRPFFQNTNKPHKIFGKKIFKYSEPLQYCQQEGASVYSINFGRPGEKKDKHLYKISEQSGGATFEAANANELNKMYSAIVKQVLNEYLITYKATMLPADKKYVKVEVNTGNAINKAVRFYFSSFVLGLPLKEFNGLLLVPFLLAFLLLWLLSLIRFEKQTKDACLEVLDAGSTKVSTKMFTLSKGKTIIGTDASAGMTVIGHADTSVSEKHAAIVFDNKKKQYTLVSQGLVKVNNKPAKTKVLTSGDVLSVGGTTIVFDQDDFRKK